MQPTLILLPKAPLLGWRTAERGESFYNPMLAPTVEDLQARGVAQESDGCMCVFLEVRGAGPAQGAGRVVRCRAMSCIVIGAALQTEQDDRGSACMRIMCRGRAMAVRVLRM